MKSWHFWLLAWCTVGLISPQWIPTWCTQRDWFHYSGAVELKDFFLSGRSVSMNNSRSGLITSLWRLSTASIIPDGLAHWMGLFSAFLLYVHSHWRCSHWKATDFLLEMTIWLRIYVVAFLHAGHSCMTTDWGSHFPLQCFSHTAKMLPKLGIWFREFELSKNLQAAWEDSK